MKKPFGLFRRDFFLKGIFSMAKTLRQIAEELGVSKQKLYRYIKQENISEAYQDGSELESRNQQIERLQAELSAERQHNQEISDKLAQIADQAQQLQLVQMQPPALPEKPSFWQRLFGKKLTLQNQQAR